MTQSKPDILIFLPWDPSYRFQYEDLIRAANPDLAIRTVGTLNDARAAIVDADIFMAFGAALTEDIFGGAERLKWVHAFGTGLDGIIDQPRLRRDVIVTSTRGIHGPPLSEIAILLMLAMARDFPRSVRAGDKHVWDRFRSQLVYRKTVGILGVGLIAADLAPRLKALGMKVIGITRTPRDIPGFDGFAPRDDLRKAVADLDFLVLLIPFEPDTREIVDAGVLAAMKKGSYLVNIARGGVLDEAALSDALKTGHLAGAALDATQKEPLPPDDPLWNAPNLIVTAHLGGFYDTYADDSIDQILTSIAHFRAGRFEAMLNRERRE
jgi:phosphoglycerate dehydrogenase-like enzyme